MHKCMATKWLCLGWIVQSSSESPKGSDGDYLFRNFHSISCSHIQTCNYLWIIFFCSVFFPSFSFARSNRVGGNLQDLLHSPERLSLANMARFKSLDFCENLRLARLILKQFSFYCFFFWILCDFSKGNKSTVVRLTDRMHRISYRFRIVSQIKCDKFLNMECDSELIRWDLRAHRNKFMAVWVSCSASGVILSNRKMTETAVSESIPNRN